MLHRDDKLCFGISIAYATRSGHAAREGFCCCVLCIAIKRNSQAMSTKPLPRELLFVKILFWIGLVVGAIMLTIGVLGVVTGVTINLLGGGSTQPGWFLGFLGFGLVETFFCVFVIVVMRTDEPNVPDRVVQLVWYLTIITLGISVAKYLVKLDSSDILRFLPSSDVALEWLLLVGFYVYVSSVFRFMENVGRYYGRAARASRFDWVNSLGRGLARYLRVA